MAGTITIFPQTEKKPLTFVGSMAGVAYGTDTTNPQKNLKRGTQCVADGHGRVLEFIDVYMKIEGYSIKVMREFMRHVGDGLTCIQDSTRYVDMTEFEYVTPPSIGKLDQKVYDEAMEHIRSAYKALLSCGVPKEDASCLLPLGMTTKVVFKKNARNLADMSQQRLCGRAYHEFRGLMKDIVEALSNYSEEWNTLASMIFMPKCEHLGYCPEKETCGRKAQKNTC